jgi:hypothetical protein
MVSWVLWSYSLLQRPSLSHGMIASLLAHAQVLCYQYHVVSFITSHHARVWYDSVEYLSFHEIQEWQRTWHQIHMLDDII